MVIHALEYFAIIRVNRYCDTESGDTRFTVPYKVGDLIINSIALHKSRKSIQGKAFSPDPITTAIFIVLIDFNICFKAPPSGESTIPNRVMTKRTSEGHLRASASHS